MANYIAGGILLLVVVAIVAYLVRKKRAGQCLMCDCGSSCSCKAGGSCQDSCGCPMAQDMLQGFSTEKRGETAKEPC